MSTPPRDRVHVLMEKVLDRQIAFGSDGVPILSEPERALLAQVFDVRDAIAKNHSPADAAKIFDIMTGQAQDSTMVRATEVRATLAARYRAALAQLRFREQSDRVTTALTAALCGAPLVLQRPAQSNFHKLLEAAADGDVLIPTTADGAAVSGWETIDPQHHVFVVEHNWAAAFDGATDFDAGEAPMPYELSLFEFQINGVHICASVRSPEAAQRTLAAYAKAADHWTLIWVYGLDSGKPLASARNDAVAESFLNEGFVPKLQPAVDLIWANVRAICISLDAEVTETALVRAPYRLNEARKKRGKLPIYDYHVVTLSRRRRTEALPRDPSAEPGARKRLHFRRGHWRHFESHKTWIRWMLVGDPDLGFVDKHYRL